METSDNIIYHTYHFLDKSDYICRTLKLKNMRKLLLSLIFTFICISAINAVEFDKYFENRSLRMDVYHWGDSKTSKFILDKFVIEKYWGGSKTILLDEFNYGSYMVKVIDAQSGKTIYTRGYCTLFQEWQTTEEASKMCRCYEESVSVPLPKNNAIIEIDERNGDGVFEKVFSAEYDPKEIYNTPEQRYDFPVYDAHVTGDPAKKIDIVIIPDGYTTEEMDKFKSDCDALVDVFRTFEPYSSYLDDFNIRGVLAPSVESGTDIPREGIWKNTIVDCHFDTFYSDRYNTTESYFAVKDVAACAPYDQIYILVNSTVYGGGGIYNYYSVSTSGNMASAKVIIHEFSHAFAGLADEYSGDVEYEEYYNLKIEPWEFNITSLVDFDSKWKFMVDKKTPIPTPTTEKYYDKVGVFEGAGYTPKGMYRPAYDCMMNTFRGDKFCPVCTYAIIQMIEAYTK